MSQNVFVETIQAAGCRFQDRAVVYDVEPALFRRDLALKLRSDVSYPENISDLFDALNDYTTQAPQLRQCLLPGTLNVTDAPRAASVDSLFRCLLSIDILQPALISTLLERLPEFYDELEQDQSSSCTARLILHQLRWLDHIVNPQKLTSTLIEIINVTPTIIQHEIITALPDIMNDTEHKQMVTFLKEWMDEHKELTVPILDTLSNLTLHSESLEDVRQKVMEGLPAAEVDDLAVMIKFLLQTVTQSTVDLTIVDLRQNMDFRTLVRLQNAATRRNQGTQQGTAPQQYPEALILESIKLGLQFHRFVSTAWIKALVALETERAHKVMDMMVIFILHSMASMKKKAEQILRKKIMARLITSKLIKETLTNHAHGLASYWGSIIALAESLLRSSHQHGFLASCAQALYTHAFKSSDAYYRQEIIGSLVTHVGSGVKEEMDVALQVLLVLAQELPSTLATYSVFLKGILDYLDNLSLAQIRMLFDVFNLLAIKGNDQQYESTLWTDLQIVVRKQLSNPRTKYKKIGILGALSSIKVLSAKDTCQLDTNGPYGGGGSSSQVPSVVPVERHPMLRQAIYLAEQLLTSCSEYPACLSMAYDELTFIFQAGDTDSRFVEWILDKVSSPFADKYMLQHSELPGIQQDMARKGGIQPVLELCHISDTDDESVMLDLFGHLIHVTDQKRKKSIIPLCSTFNLLQVCERQMNDGSLEGVDALLMCGIILFDLKNMETVLEDWPLDHEELACHLLYTTINWFRETINCFSVVDHDESIHKILIQRLKELSLLEALLNMLLERVPQFTPLELQASSLLEKDTAFTPQLAIKPAITSSAVITSSPLVAQDSDNESTSTTQTAATGTSKRVNAASKQNTPRKLTVDTLRPYLRPIKIQTLVLLESAAREDELRLSVSDINYLLQDIAVKLEAKLGSPMPAFFGKKKTNPMDAIMDRDTGTSRMTSRAMMIEMTRYLPNILQALEVTNEQLQADATQSGRVQPGSDELVQCVFLVMNIICTMFSWHELDHPENQDILEALIREFAHRLDLDTSQWSFMDECKYAFRYLSAFQDNMPQFKTAVCLYKTLERMMHLSCSTQHLRKGTQRVASEILARDWFDWRDCSKEIPFLLEKTIELSEDPLSLLNQYVNVVLPAFEREGRLADHPLLSKHTIVSYYQAMINQATKLLVLLDSTDQEVEAVLARTAEVVKIFAAITQYVKSKEQRALFALLLKSSRFFVDQFIKHSIPFFTKAFKEYHAEIAPIFSTFQLATRPLQIMCSHVKVKKDLQLAAFVPPLKRALEIVIYQVKILLSENNAPTDVFFLGSLKHRDLHGAMVSSQIPKEDSDDESNDELNSSPSDDDDVPMTSRRAAAASKTKKGAPKPRNTGKTTGKRKSGSVPDRPPRTNSQIRDSDEDDSDDNDREESDSEMPLIHQLSSSAPRKRAPSTASDTADEDDDDDDGPPASPIPRTSQTSYGSRVVSPIGEDYDDEQDVNDDAPRSPAKRTVSKIFDLSKPSTASASKYFGNQADSTPKKRYGMSATRKRPKNDNPSDRPQ